MGWRSALVVGDRRPGDPLADPAHQPAARSHPEPHHPLRAHLLHRHPGGRRDRGGGERAPPPRSTPGRKQGLARTVLDAVDEVGNPTILATFAVIAAILPMAFVRGLMGPYMRPIPIGGSLAMLFSLASPSSSRPGRRCGCMRHDHALALGRGARDLVHAGVPADHAQAAALGSGAAGIPRAGPGALRRRGGAGRRRVRPGEDAALRQQVRVPGLRGSAGRAHPGAGARGGPAAGAHACSRTRTWRSCRCTRWSRRR